jgi:hypothetical protein
MTFSQPLYEVSFELGALLGRNPGPTRPQIQRQARALTEAAPNPYNKVRDGGLSYPYPGRGPNGETTN